MVLTVDDADDSVQAPPLFASAVGSRPPFGAVSVFWRRRQLITNLYIDGFNLYYRALKDTPFRWLNLHKLAETLFPEDTIHRVCYFTARRLLVDDDEAEPFMPVPWFWSDQYDHKIQMAGRVGLDDDMHCTSPRATLRRGASPRSTAAPVGWRSGFQPPPPRNALPNAHRIRHLLRRRHPLRHVYVEIVRLL